jgi:hypothetical protein
MGYIKRIVCLANSFKNGGSCVAGKEILLGGHYGGWIRPVSARPTAELWLSESMYDSYASPKLLDIIDVPLLKAIPHDHQSENHLIDPAVSWTKKGELPRGELELLCDYPATLWLNRGRTSNGAFDCVGREESALFAASLYFIKADCFTVEVGPGRWKGTKTYRGNFRYREVEHSLRVTDPEIAGKFESKQDGRYPLQDVHLCVSLTEPFEMDKRCHKLVASVILNGAL